uniref:ST8 alpha-N-acetyl-neuraminide alpha-2,8-sialyltransferase 6 n=1 Tax=Leptobrachium leishanense TaxID=445787 RepID=A0A8C5MAQ2_9ANUR
MCLCSPLLVFWCHLFLSICVSWSHVPSVRFIAPFHHLYLEACCNAAMNLLVTQNNTHIGDNITYETQKTFLLSPQTSPLFNKRIRSCAVVGNGGILLNSCCGSEIDKADYVFRFNLAPLNYSNDTGTKTNLITANPSILIESQYGPSLILMPAFSFPSNTVVSFKAYYTLEDFGSQQKVVYFHPNYLDNLAVYWKKKGLAVRRLSSGLMIVSTALEICNKVTLYGFWPFAQDFNGKPIPNHYYNKNPPNRYMHSMPSEFFLYSQMHSKGILKLKVGRCF